VDQHKHAVVLLDEIEKAHADIYNILLQVMDHGSLTDALGKKVDFRNVVLIMTTNAGASDAQKNSIGFGRGRNEGETEEAFKRLFTPEFRNRLDANIAFGSLTPEIIRQVVHKFVIQLEAQLADRNVTIELEEPAADWLAKNGFDELYGARPLARVIQEHIKKPLADEILFGKLVKGGHVVVKLEDGKIGFDIDKASGAEVRAREASEEAEGDEASELV
jgi:ATP-dependent Clp protease ATP-binding subunit ClpA